MQIVTFAETSPAPPASATGRVLVVKISMLSVSSATTGAPTTTDPANVSPISAEDQAAMSLSLVAGGYRASSARTETEGREKSCGGGRDYGRRTAAAARECAGGYGLRPSEYVTWKALHGHRRTNRKSLASLCVIHRPSLIDVGPMVLGTVGWPRFCFWRESEESICQPRPADDATPSESFSKVSAC